MLAFLSSTGVLASVVRDFKCLVTSSYYCVEWWRLPQSRSGPSRQLRDLNLLRMNQKKKKKVDGHQLKQQRGKNQLHAEQISFFVLFFFYYLSSIKNHNEMLICDGFLILYFYWVFEELSLNYYIGCLSVCESCSCIPMAIVSETIYTLSVSIAVYGMSSQVQWLLHYTVQTRWLDVQSCIMFRHTNPWLASRIHTCLDLQRDRNLVFKPLFFFHCFLFRFPTPVWGRG